MSESCPRDEETAKAFKDAGIGCAYDVLQYIAERGLADKGGDIWSNQRGAECKRCIDLVASHLLKPQEQS